MRNAALCLSQTILRTFLIEFSWTEGAKRRKRQDTWLKNTEKVELVGPGPGLSQDHTLSFLIPSSPLPRLPCPAVSVAQNSLKPFCLLLWLSSVPHWCPQRPKRLPSCSCTEQVDSLSWAPMGAPLESWPRSISQRQQAPDSPLATIAKISERRQVTLEWDREISEDTHGLLPLSNKNSNNNNPLHLWTLSWRPSAPLCLWFSFVLSVCTSQTL